jgi:pimeloyl-ACP methyl ester carboxylesterase
LAAPGGFSGRSVLMSYIVGLQRAILPRDRVVAAMSARLARRVPTFFADKTNPAIDKILAGYEAMKDRKDYSLWIMALVGMARSLLRVDLTGRARRITVPTLVVWGDRDEVLPPAGAARAGESMGDWATVIMIPGVGHLPFIEATERFNTEVDGFLATLGL